MGEHFSGMRNINLQVISFVTRRLISGHKSEFTKRIGQELDVRINPKVNNDLFVGIKGQLPNAEIARRALDALDKQAAIIARNYGLTKTSEVRQEHWSHIGVDLDKLLTEARAELFSKTGTAPVITPAIHLEKQRFPVNDDLNLPVDQRFFDVPNKPVATAPSAPAASPNNAAFTQATHAAAPAAESAAHKIKKRIPLKTPQPDFEPRNKSQAITYVAALDTVPGETEGARRKFVNSFLFAGGPAGGGKTYSALKAAWDAYRMGLIDEIIIIRPPTTAGKDPGAMPGDQKKKSAPYLTGGIASNLEKITGLTMKELEEKKVVRAITPDFERGETYGTEESPVCVVVDEPQNLTVQQAELLITRPFEGSLMIWCGDIGGKQNDLKNQVPGLAHLIATQGSGKMNDAVLDKAAAFVKFTEEDSSARNRILPHVLKALNSPPDAYAALMKTFNAVGVNAKLAESIEGIRLYAVEVLDKTAEMTSKQYEKKLQVAFPELFPGGATNVTRLKTAGRHLQSS